MGVLYFFLCLLEATVAFNVTFSTDSVKIFEDQVTNVNFSWTGEVSGNPNLELSVTDTSVARIANSWLDYNESIGNVVVEGLFLGRTKLEACMYSDANRTCDDLPVTVLKKERAVTKAFIISVAIVVTLSYVNMGCALDLPTVKSVLLKPIGPLVGFSCQYLIMPLMAYGVAKMIFSDPVMQLGLFTFGCSPSGGASNMWTVLLNGNLNLSLTVTFINNVLALGMMPLWLFTLGRSFFVTTSVPFRNIFTSLICMVVPLGIGLAMQRWFPRAAKFLKKILGLMSVVIILFIIIFGTYANLYMFKLFSWKIVLAAVLTVWFGFALAATVSCIVGLPMADRVAVIIETGIQNTGIAYVLLNSSLHPPDSDIASVIPVAGSIVTPIPLALIYLYQRFRNCHFVSYVSRADEESKKIIPN